MQAQSEQSLSLHHAAADEEIMFPHHDGDRDEVTKIWIPDPLLCHFPFITDVLHQ